MILDQLKKLSEEDRKLLMSAPAIASLLAASTDGVVSDEEKAEALEISHLKTFSAPEDLRPYYKEVEKVFKEDMESLLASHSPIDQEQQEILKQKLEKAYEVLGKIDSELRDQLKDSLNSYAVHLGRMHQNFLVSFVFPLEIPGITN